MTPPPSQRHARTRISENEPGGPILDYLAGRFTYHDREAWRMRVQEGRLRVNEGPASVSTMLVPGDRLEFLMPEGSEPPVDTSYRVVFEDDALLVVDKPPDLPCHPAGRYFQNTLWWLLRQRAENETPVSLIHRIDRETSGLVLAAKAPWAAASLARQFRSGTVFKRYRVIVEGVFPLTEVEARGFLTAHPNSAVRKRRRYVPVRPAREDDTPVEACHTRFRGEAVHGGVSLVEAVCVTGRLHQIRATLSGLGYPVVGDKIYGRDEGCFLRFIRGGLTAGDSNLLRLPRQALHAAELNIAHPATGGRLRFVSPMPGDMRRLLESEDPLPLPA